MWDGVAAEVRGIVDPLMLKAMISTAVAAYMGLLILPEPVTKVVAVSLTTILIAYVGWNAFFDILDGWRELTARSERAASFRELEDAGHHFGGVMGRDGARVIIMAVTAALGGGAANLASKAPRLPAFARAALAARTNAGFELSVALEGGARSVTVAEGVMTVGVAPNVVAAVAAGSPGTAIRPGGIGSGAARAGFIDPKAVRFSQDSIKSSFNDGRSIDELAEGLRSGTIKPGDVPAIRVFERDGKLFTLDNRRLEAFRRAGVEIPYRQATPEEIADEAWKFTTKNAGESVRVRGE